MTDRLSEVPEPPPAAVDDRLPAALADYASLSAEDAAGLGL